MPSQYTNTRTDTDLLAKFVMNVRLSRRAFLEWLERHLAGKPAQPLRLRLALFYQLLPYRNSVMEVIHLGLQSKFRRGLARLVTGRFLFLRKSSGPNALGRARRLNRTLIALTKVEESYRETQRPVQQWQFKRRRVSVEKFLT